MRKIHSKKGFTLVELLIVVAILAILVAIAVPVFTLSLDKAKLAADDANYRAAKASSTVEYLQATYEAGGTNDASGKYFTSDGTWVAAAAIDDAYAAQSSTYSATPYIQADASGGVDWVAAP